MIRKMKKRERHKLVILLIRTFYVGTPTGACCFMAMTLKKCRLHFTFKALKWSSINSRVSTPTSTLHNPKKKRCSQVFFLPLFVCDENREHCNRNMTVLMNGGRDPSPFFLSLFFLCDENNIEVLEADGRRKMKCWKNVYSTGWKKNERKLNNYVKFASQIYDNIRELVAF